MREVFGHRQARRASCGLANRRSKDCRHPGTVMTEVSVPNSGERAPISVSELNALASRTIEQAIPMLWVTGEVSNWTRAASGHCYFVLKDATAQVRCTLFRHRLQLIERLPANGDRIEVRALPSVYQARGEFQLNVEFLRLGGTGRLFEAFERLKQKLRDEGLFESARKRPLPRFPKRVGIVTSPAGAALRDVLSTLQRRMPAIEVFIYPTLVQGAEAAPQIVQALRWASERGECDVIVLCRGGGGIEDLWSFNEEVVARAIAACTLPVITGVGHETDFTIADFVADVRAPTPTGAAELVSPDGPGLRVLLAHWHERFKRSVERQIAARYQHVDLLARRLVHPGKRIEAQAKAITELRHRLNRCLTGRLDRHRWQLREALASWRAAVPKLASRRYAMCRAADGLVRLQASMKQAQQGRLASLAGKLEALAPLSVLRRGYSIVRDQAGDILSSSERLQAGDMLTVQFHRGQVAARVADVAYPSGEHSRGDPEVRGEG